MSPTFGQIIKGARLGWGYCYAIGAFVRISDAATGQWKIEVRDAADLPSHVDDTTHRRWWSGPNTTIVDAAIARVVGGGLRVTGVRRPLAFLIDDAGNAVARLR